MIGYHLEWKRERRGGGGGASFEIGRQISRGRKNFGRRWTREVGVLKIGQSSWTSYVYHPLCKSSTLDQIEEQRKIKVDSKLNL